MADLAAQREARRRRITQNAEARMNRLLGVVDKKTESAETPIPPILPQSNEHPVTNGPDQPEAKNIVTAPDSSPAYNLRQRSSQSPAQTFRGVTVNNNSSSSIKDGDHEPLLTHLTGADKPIWVKPKDKVEDHGEDTSQLKPQTEKPDDAKTFELVHILGCVIAAFAARYILRFGIGLFYFETITLPFVGLQLVFAYLNHTHFQLSRPPPVSNLWSTALMLCGIRQDLISHYNSIMAQVTLAFSDFCLYLFAFLLWNAAFG